MSSDEKKQPLLEKEQEQDVTVAYIKHLITNQTAKNIKALSAIFSINLALLEKATKDGAAKNRLLEFLAFIDKTLEDGLNDTSHEAIVIEYKKHLEILLNEKLDQVQALIKQKQQKKAAALFKTAVPFFLELFKVYNPCMGILATDLHIIIPSLPLIATGIDKLDMHTLASKLHVLAQLKLDLSKTPVIHGGISLVSAFQLIVNAAFAFKNGVEEFGTASRAHRYKVAKFALAGVTTGFSPALTLGGAAKTAAYVLPALPHIALAGSLSGYLMTLYMWYLGARSVLDYIDADRNLKSPDYFLKDRVTRCAKIRKSIEQLKTEKNKLKTVFIEQMKIEKANNIPIESQYKLQQKHNKALQKNERKQQSLEKKLGSKKNEVLAIFFGEIDDKPKAFSNQQIDTLYQTIFPNASEIKPKPSFQGRIEALFSDKEEKILRKNTAKRKRKLQLKQIKQHYNETEKTLYKKQYQQLRTMQQARKTKALFLGASAFALGLGIAVITTAFLFHPPILVIALLGGLCITTAATIGFTTLERGRAQKKKKQAIKKAMNKHLRDRFQSAIKPDFETLVDTFINQLSEKKHIAFFKDKKPHLDQREHIENHYLRLYALQAATDYIKLNKPKINIKSSSKKLETQLKPVDKDKAKISARAMNRYTDHVRSKHMLNDLTTDAIIRAVFNIKTKHLPKQLTNLSPTHLQAIEDQFVKQHAALRLPSEKLTTQSYIIAREQVKNTFKKNLKSAAPKNEQGKHAHQRKRALDDQATHAMKTAAQKTGLPLQNFIAHHPAVYFNPARFFEHLNEDKPSINDHEAIPSKKTGNIGSSADPDKNAPQE